MSIITWENLKPSDFKRHKDFDFNGLYFAKIDGGNYYIFRDTGGIRSWYVQRSVNGSDERFSMATSKRDAVEDLKKKFGQPEVTVEPVNTQPHIVPAEYETIKPNLTPKEKVAFPF